MIYTYYSTRLACHIPKLQYFKFDTHAYLGYEISAFINLDCSFCRSLVIHFYPENGISSIERVKVYTETVNHTFEHDGDDQKVKIVEKINN